MTAYNRPELIFSDMDCLRVVAKGQPLQIVLTDLAHPNDGGRKEAIRGAPSAYRRA